MWAALGGLGSFAAAHVAAVLSVVVLIRRRAWPLGLAALLVSAASFVLMYRPEWVRCLLGP